MACVLSGEPGASLSLEFLSSGLERCDFAFSPSSGDDVKVPESRRAGCI